MNDGEMTTTRLAGVGHYKYNNQHKNDDNVARQKLAQQYVLDGTTGQHNTRTEHTTVLKKNQHDSSFDKCKLMRE
jgi:hypothetical protein